MAHGYLREFDEAPDRGEDRGRSRDDERERSWRGDRDGNFMLGEREPGRGREEDRFSGEDRQYRSTQANDWGVRGDYSRSERDWDRFGARGDRERSPRNFNSHQDDHYRSWRDRQIEALDRDYDEYRREREQQFHREFDEWRRRKHGNPEPLRTGMTQTGLSSDPTGELQLTTDQQATTSTGSDPLATATLGNEGGEGR